MILHVETGFHFIQINFSFTSFTIEFNTFTIREFLYRVCGLRLSLNFGVRLMALKNFYLWLAAEKLHAFAVSTEKYLL